MIIAIDPGETVGFAIADNEKSPLLVGQVNMYEIYDILETYKPKHVIVESFRPYPHTAKSLIWNSLPAPKVIGVIELWCLRNNVPLTEQSASSRKLVSNELLRKYGFWKLTKNMPHARDAARHLVLYLIRIVKEGAECS